MSLHLRVRLPALLALASLAAACGSTTTDDGIDDPQPKNIEIAGTWDTSFGDTITISSEKWGTAAITKFDNTKRFAITQTPADAEYNPGKFNKHAWTAPQSSTFYYCNIDAGENTAADAENTTKTADETNLLTGCGGIPWTKMVPWVEKIDVIGSWDDTYGFNTTITKDSWGGSAITKFDNAKRYAIIQNPSDAQYDPSKFNKNVWTVLKDGSFSFCTVDFGKDSAADAENTTKTADESNLASGCGGFGWTTVVTHSPFAVAGTWDEQFADTPTEITATTWGVSTVTTYNNATRTAIVQLPADDQWNPSKFSKFVWTAVESNVFFYCTIEFGKETADDAANGTNVADPSNPAAGGCGGFPWTKMTRKTN